MMLSGMFNRTLYRFAGISIGVFYMFGGIMRSGAFLISGTLPASTLRGFMRLSCIFTSLLLNAI
ncbi:hypothetical protein SAMN05421510_101435 [Nitrosomonas ureae]|uniref:Uncharacterized protein n=1 Tax=Nitrosomonas ureae TaxID=44577 RepID=A0A1H9CF51_9PROT|nr:hypothetical protein SAMN05421510_101435 [Nitrosomonas ureae]